MTFQVSEISSDSARTMIARQFGGFFGEFPLRQALAADHIRSALYTNAKLAIEQNVSPAVHTSRLLTSVRKTLDLLWPGAGTEQLEDGATTEALAQQTLDSLKKFGEIVDTGGGYWLGTPLRLVSSGDSSLAMGAAPNAVLKALLGASPVCAGISRFSNGRPEKSADHAISVCEWLGSAQEIRSWTKTILGQHEQGMQSGNDIPADQLEIFAPDLLSGAQRNPWISAQAVGRSLPGPRLCRPLNTVAFAWDRPFYLCHLRLSSGGLVVSRSVRVGDGITRRLRFGLSNLYGENQIVTGTIRGKLVELEMPLALPYPEARIAALGWPLPPNPRRTVFHRLAIPFLTEVLRRLGVQLVVP